MVRASSPRLRSGQALRPASGGLGMTAGTGSKTGRAGHLSLTFFLFRHSIGPPLLGSFYLVPDFRLRPLRSAAELLSTARWLLRHRAEPIGVSEYETHRDRNLFSVGDRRDREFVSGTGAERGPQVLSIALRYSEVP